MRSIALRLFAFVALIVLAAAWTKEGQLLLFFPFCYPANFSIPTY